MSRASIFLCAGKATPSQTWCHSEPHRHAGLHLVKETSAVAQDVMRDSFRKSVHIEFAPLGFCDSSETHKEERDLQNSPTCPVLKSTLALSHTGLVTLHADGDIRENAHEYLSALDDLELARECRLRASKLLGTQPCRGEQANAIHAFTDRGALERATTGDRHSPLVRLAVLDPSWCKLRAMSHRCSGRRRCQGSRKHGARGSGKAGTMQ